MTGIRVLFQIKIITILKLGIVGFGFGIENVFEMGVTLGSEDVDEIINQNIGESDYKEGKVQENKNYGNKKKGNKTIDTGLLDEIEGYRAGVGKITDSLNGGVTIVFGGGFDVGQKKVMDVENNITNGIFETSDREKAKIIVNQTNHQSSQDDQNNRAKAGIELELFDNQRKKVDGNKGKDSGNETEKKPKEKTSFIGNNLENKKKNPTATGRH